MQPDAINFETLASVYGVIGGTRPPAPVYETQNDDISNIPENRSLRTRFGVKQGEEDSALELPTLVRRKMEEIDAFVLGDVQVGSGWRMLHETQHGRALEMDLGDGYKVQLHFLLAN